MLSGVIPLAYASDGPSFILEDYPEHLVPIGDIEALAQRLSSFANQTELVSLRQKLRASIDKRFSPEVIAQQWRDLLIAG